LKGEAAEKLNAMLESLEWSFSFSPKDQKVSLTAFGASLGDVLGNRRLD
jgi:hypothetical protein